MNIPNSLTILRILLIPVYVGLLVYERFDAAMGVLLLAGVTDALDGTIARAANQRTRLGAFLDPLADKLLLTSGFITLSTIHLIPSWVTIVVVSRDAMAVKKYYATPKGRYAIDKFLLKTPVFGDLIRKASVAKFTRTLGTLLSSGVPLLDGLSICAKTSGNKIIEEALMNARISISGGKTIADPLTASQVFPKMVTHMLLPKSI